MREDEIRAKIRQKLQKGTLPGDLTLVRKLQAGHIGREPNIAVGLLKSSPCAGCDEVDPTYRIGDVAIRFHAECARIWDEERTPVHRRA